MYSVQVEWKRTLQRAMRETSFKVGVPGYGGLRLGLGLRFRLGLGRGFSLRLRLCLRLRLRGSSFLCWFLALLILCLLRLSGRALRGGLRSEQSRQKGPRDQLLACKHGGAPP